MAHQWELDTMAAINERRTDLGLPTLEWSIDLESEARNYWSNPSLSPHVINTCNCPHWTSPKRICDLLWCDELANYLVESAAVVIFNDSSTHAALALAQKGMVGGNDMRHRQNPARHIKQGRNTMKHQSKHAPMFETPQVMGGNRITGSEEAKALRNKYQTELDNANAALVNMIHHTEQVNRRKAVDYLNQSQALKEDVKARQAERNALIDTLDAQIDKERGQEYRMWKQSPQGLKINTTEGLKSEVSQAGLGLVGTISPAQVLKYLEQYPKLASSPFILEIVGKIERKEEEIRRKAEAYHQAVSGFNHELPFYEKNVLKCQENLNRYHKILEEGTGKINNCRYVNCGKGFFFRLLPQTEKDNILLQTLPHTTEKWESMITLFKKDLDQYQKHPFTELSYT